MNRIIRFDSKRDAEAFTVGIRDQKMQESIDRGNFNQQYWDGTTRYFSVYENVLSGQFGVFVPSKYWNEIDSIYHSQISLASPLWIDEKFINGEPFGVIGMIDEKFINGELIGIAPFPFGIVDPMAIRSKLEAAFHPTLLAEIRGYTRKYCASVANEAQNTIQNILNTKKGKNLILENLNPYKFEEMVAELLIDQGYDIYLTPKSADGGKDIIAVFHTQNGPALMLVECKRKKIDSTLGPVVVRALLGVFSVENAEGKNFSRALMVTTAKSIGPAAINCSEKIDELNLLDYEELMKWIRSYGNIKNGLWIPDQFEKFLL